VAFVTDQQLLEAVADRLKVAAKDLPDHYAATIVPQANAGAYQEILGRLLNRGFTKSQIDQFDRGAEFQLSIGLYLSVVNGGAYAGFDPEVVRALDRRRELDTVLVFVSGVWVKPDLSGPGQVTTAGPSAEGGLFNWPSPDDPNLGEYTRW
jgi:hypothetical protein